MTSGECVAFVCPRFVGHFFPTLSLANRFKQSYRIVYLFVEGFEECVFNELIANGFDYEDLSGQIDGKELQSCLSGSDHLRSLAFLDALKTTFCNIRDKYGVRVFLLDNYLSSWGVPLTLMHSTVVSLHLNYCENRFVALKSGSFNYIRGSLREVLSVPLQVLFWFRNRGLFHDYRFGIQSVVRKCSRESRLPVSFCPYTRLLKFSYPSFVLAPRELIGERESEYQYLGLCLDEKSGDSHAVNWKYPGRKRVYISLGTLSKGSRFDVEFVRNAVAAFDGLDDFEVIVHASDEVHSSLSKMVSNNVRVYQWVSQIDLIREGDIVLSHGGLGTVKECLFYGVPMLLFPLSTEQMYNARRVVAIGVGLSAPIANATAKRIHGMCRHVLAEKSYKNNIRKLRDEVKFSQSSIEGLAALDDVITKSGLRTGSLGLQGR